MGPAQATEMLMGTQRMTNVRRTWLRQYCGRRMTYMLDSIVRHTANPDFAVLNRILDGPPRLETGLLPTIWRVQEEQINVTKAALLDRALDCFSSRLVGAIGRELRSEMDIFSLERLRICLARQIV